MWRDSLLRYCGYANEVGESFRPLVSVQLVRASYGVSGVYVLGDAHDKYKKNGPVAGLDALIWQSLASVMIPGYVINRIVWATKYVIPKAMPPHPARYLPTAIGLGSIPFIIHPIDEFTHYLLDGTLRRLLSRIIASFSCDSLGGARPLCSHSHHYIFIFSFYVFIIV